MVLARLVGADQPDLLTAFARIGLPRPLQEAFGKRAGQTILLTGLSPEQERFLRTELGANFLHGHPEHRPGSALIVADGERLARLIETSRARSDLKELALGLSRAVQLAQTDTEVVIGKRTFPLNQRTYLMGVLNVTPDSFSDGGQFLSPELAVKHGMNLIDEGADLIDVGGESTRPGASGVDAAEEMSRVLPVIRGLRAVTDIPISIDTTKAAVAEEAIRAGADFVNDISGFTLDPELAQVVARGHVGCCLMHMQGTPRTMQVNPSYQDVVSEVIEFLDRAIQRAERAGVDRSRIFIDPGIGFGKSVGHNLFLLRHLRDLRVLGCPVVVGTSRKSFLGRLTNDKPVSERLFATAASVAAVAAEGGANMVRVHNVAAAKDALLVADAIYRAGEGGDLFGADSRVVSDKIDSTN